MDDRSEDRSYLEGVPQIPDPLASALAREGPDRPLEAFEEAAADDWIAGLKQTIRGRREAHERLHGRIQVETPHGIDSTIADR